MMRYWTTQQVIDALCHLDTPELAELRRDIGWAKDSLKHQLPGMTTRVDLIMTIYDDGNGALYQHTSEFFAYKERRDPRPILLQAYIITKIRQEEYAAQRIVLAQVPDMVSDRDYISALDDVMQFAKVRLFAAN